MAKRLDLKDVNIYYGKFHAVADVGLSVPPRSVTAFIGPSGCGKSTVLRSLNRMHEVTPGARVEGSVLLDGEDSTARRSTRSASARPSAWCSSGPTRSPRCRSATTWSPGSSCRACATRRSSTRSPSSRCAERTCGTRSRPPRQAGGGLSGGQQQRLCIARAIAVSPDVLLMDEPCSALDPISTLAIEDLITELKKDFTIVIVTHNMQQAARVSDQTAFFNLEATGKPGRLIEIDDTEKIFSNPTQKATEDYISGPFRLIVVVSFDRVPGATSVAPGRCAFRQLPAPSEVTGRLG
ncbi:ATP-binding cassette domain-containing protein [Rhodococcus hoagii]|nr:ATP-binding cassette domain-containing protein [Prescottella equi]